MISEIYPIGIRSQAVSVSTLGNWAANLLVAATFLSLGNLITRQGTFFLYAAIGVGAFVFFLTKAPETKGPHPGTDPGRPEHRRQPPQKGARMTDTTIDAPADATIDQVEVSAYTVPTDAPEADGTISWDSTTMVLVRARSGDVEGIGWTYAPTACATLIKDKLAGLVKRRNALDVAGSSQAMIKAVRNAGRPGIAGYGISAVDVALWDLKARLLDLPLHHLLGAVRSSVPVYGSGGFTTYDERQLSHQLGHWALEQRIPRVKIKIGESWGADPGRDLDRMRQARAIIDEKTELFVDANGGYTRKQAVRVARRFAELGVTWFEEPVSSDDLDGLHEIRGLVDADVAAGEYGYHLAYFQHMVAAGAVDVVQADVTRCGGITEWLRVAALAAGAGLEISGHCAPSLHAAVACAVPNLRHLEYFADHARVDRLLLDGVLDPDSGVLRPDRSRPGLGLTVKDEAQQYRQGG